MEKTTEKNFTIRDSVYRLVKHESLKTGVGMGVIADRALTQWLKEEGYKIEQALVAPKKKREKK